MILFRTINIAVPTLDEKKITRWIKSTVKGFDKITGIITLIFCTDDKILEINREYLQHEYYTDIITFDYSKKNIVSGDVFISVETVQANAEKYEVTFEKEILRVIIHGILHLCGLEDDTPDAQRIMTFNEDNALLRYFEIVI
ncbi:MAG TPA: rRNA maturation RNase YbeY [Bacteroidales bacterium]|nr:rRNA maturation RNase YbeY [Paludibacter sp.]HOS17009.1 rRNA maturation RNase YbeY [Bacteroidales bacterium]HPM09386.1 rRNA maturation RNase YbeY [Paludibacter sp.]